MNRISWLMLKLFMGPLLMSFGVILFILLMQFLAGYIDEIAGKGIEIYIIASLFGYASGKLTLLALPVAVLTAALMTYGSLGEHNELAALKSSGISLWKIGKPMFIFALFLTGISLWFSFQVVPMANLRFHNLLYDIGKTKAEMSLQPGQFYQDIDGYAIRVSDKNIETRTLYDVVIYDHPSGKGIQGIIAADSARTISNQQDESKLSMVLFHGVRHAEYPPEGNEQTVANYGRTYFDSLHYSFRLEGFDLENTDESLFKRHELTRNQQQLKKQIEETQLKEQKQRDAFQQNIGTYNSLSAETLPKITAEPHHALSPMLAQKMDSLFPFSAQSAINPVISIERALTAARAIQMYASKTHRQQQRTKQLLNRNIFEYHFRISNPLQVFFFMLIGIALGAIIRKGGLGVPALLSTLLLVLSYILSTQGRKLTKEMIIDPVFAAWLPSLIFGLLSIYLIYKAANESRLLTEQFWSRSIFSFFVKNKAS